MNELTPARPRRIESIDIVRGLAMVVMALDHVRDYFHITANTDDPLNLATTSPALYFTRWITHYCAPVFVFLSGTSVYLQSLRKTPRELGLFLLKRGLWLILMEWTLVAFAWTFNTNFNIIPFQVIWAIGISMFILGLLILARLPFRVLLVLGLVIVCGHNLLDIPESKPGFRAGFWWDLFHTGVFRIYPITGNQVAMLVYPFVAWTGLMILGYCAGILFTPRFTAVQRKKILLRGGLGLIVFFVLLRYSNVYGDPVDWTRQDSPFYTFLSFIKVNKYPPSLLYLCITIGPALVLLALIEETRNRLTGILVHFGRTAFFYYILHLYLIHLLAAIFFFARGHSFADAKNVGAQYPFMYVVPGEGYGLPVVYGVWLLVLVLLYPLCKKYDRYKTAHKEKWWLSYL